MSPVSEAGPTDRRPPYRFSVRTRVDFSDTDAGGVLYYGRYPRYIDKAVVAYRRHLGVGLLGEPGHLFVVRALGMQYHASARFDDPLEVFVRTSRIGRSSHTVEIRVERVDHGDRVLLAEGEQTLVGVTAYDDPRPSEMPSGMRQAIARFEGMGEG